jgi:hypothetical protein
MAIIRILFFLPFFLQALIIQTDNQKEVLKYVDTNTWALFDIDDTLVEMTDKSKRELADPSLASLITSIQEIAAHTLALTAHHQPICLSTLKQLEHFNLDFSLTAPADNSSFVPYALYEGGIWFLTDANQKGVTMRKWLGSLSNKPQKVLFVDNCQRHLENMEQELSDLDIEYVGIHYTKAFEPLIDALELQDKFLLDTLTEDEPFPNPYENTND